MFATQSISAQRYSKPMEHFVNDPQPATISKDRNLGYFPVFDPNQEFSWAEQVYRTGDVDALVATYDNIPPDLKKKLDQLIATGYCKNLFMAPFYEASLLLLTSNAVPNFRSWVERAQRISASYCATEEQQRASSFVSCRKSNDIVVLVLKSGSLVSTMTLFPFNEKKAIPSLSYLNLGSGSNQLCDVSGVEVGRLATATLNGGQHAGLVMNLRDTLPIAAAFVVARDFVSEHGLVDQPESFVCGDTYGSFLSSLQRFFPIKIVESEVRPDIIDDKCRVRDVAIYFLQRQVLGSFENTEQFISAINDLSRSHPRIANRITALMKAGLKSSGINTLREFDPKKFRVSFFYFPFDHPKTKDGFQRLEKIMLKMTTRQSACLTTQHQQNIVDINPVISRKRNETSPPENRRRGANGTAASSPAAD